MEIVGHGFLARHFRPIANRHPRTVVLAVGVSAANHTEASGFDREAAVLYRVIERCAATGSRLVFFSTAAAGMYAADNGEPGCEDAPVYPPTTYGRHKLALETVLIASGVDCLVLRLSHVVGPGQAAHQLLSGLASQLQAGEVRVLLGATRDLIDVTHVVSITDALLTAGVNREVVNVASGHGIPVELIIRRLQLLLGVTARWTTVPGTPSQQVCTAKLRSLVPEVDRMGFGPDYYRVVLDRYAPGYRRVDGTQR